MNRYLIIALFFLLAACGGGEGMVLDPVTENTDSQAGNPEDGNAESEYVVPNTPQADIPPVAVKGWESMEPGLIVGALMHPHSICSTVQKVHCLSAIRQRMCRGILRWLPVWCCSRRSSLMKMGSGPSLFTGI